MKTNRVCVRFLDTFLSFWRHKMKRNMHTDWHINQGKNGCAQARETQVYRWRDTYNNRFLEGGYQGNGSLSHICNNTEKETGTKKRISERKNNSICIQRSLSLHEVFVLKCECVCVCVVFCQLFVRPIPPIILSNQLRALYFPEPHRLTHTSRHA